MSLVLRILLKEAAVGILLFFTLGRDGRADALFCAVVSAGLVLLTRSRSLLGRKDTMGMATECLVILCGAFLFCHLLILLSGLMGGRN